MSENNSSNSSNPLVLTEPFVYCHVIGGLGNQLFQIFNLISYSLENNMKFYIPLEEAEKKERPFYWKNFLVHLKPYLVDKKEFYKYNIPVFNEYSFEYNQIPKIDRTFKFFGYFQSYMYFEKHKEEIYKMIKLEEFRNKYKNEYDYTNTISLHFRLGDYIHLQNHHPLIPKKYYVTCLNRLINSIMKDGEKEEKQSWKVIYFCEENQHDLMYVNKMLVEIQKELVYDRNLFNLTFEKIDDKYEDWEQLLVMSLCTHNIIANSTYSWFGAYFNSNPNKLVFYPRTWFGPSEGNKNTKDLFPSNWNKVECQ